MTPSHRTIPAKKGVIHVTKEESRLYPFINGNMSSEQLKTMAGDLFECPGLPIMVRGLQPGDQVRFVDRADRALNTVDPDNVRLLVSLGIVCSVTGHLPSSAMLSTGLEKCEDVPILSAGLTDVWAGIHGHQPVIIEAFRDYPPQLLEELKEILFRWIPIFMRLSHTNILPFRGVNSTLFQLALVYDRVNDGNIVEYTTAHPDASRMDLLLQVAEGLRYLHSLGIAHGDLRVINVLIDGVGRARLTKYGLGSIKRNPRLAAAANSQAVEGLLAPELIDVTTPSITESKSADVFAFSMLAFEVLTTLAPFGGRPPTITALSILQGTRPEFPQGVKDVGLTVKMQDFLQRCWDENPAERPTMDVVVNTLELLNKNEEREATSGKIPGANHSAPETLTQSTELRTTTRTKRKWLCGLF